MEPNTGKAIGSNKSAVWDPTMEGDGLKAAMALGTKAEVLSLHLLSGTGTVKLVSPASPVAN